MKIDLQGCYKHSRIWGDFYEHDWAYRINKRGIVIERECLKCGSVQIYFGLNEYVEDWRNKLTNK